MNRPELTLVEHFQSIQDYRENHNKQHLLIDIIVVAVCCVICGADNFVEIQTIASEKLDWLRTFLSLPNGIPSHDTFNRVVSSSFRGADLTSFRACPIGLLDAE